MTADTLSFRELMGWTAGETRKWEAWFRERPDALAVSMGDSKYPTVGAVIYHVFMVERRYADRLVGEPVSSYSDPYPTNVEGIFAEFAPARERLERFVAGATGGEWAEVITFETLSAGTLTASKRKVVAHALMHGIRHWAQIATALRQAGHGGQWMHDILGSPALE